MSATYTSRIQGIETSSAIKAPVRAATTANTALSGLQTIDGVALADGDRVLVRNQTTGSEDGIYNVGTGAWTRARDWNNVRDIEKGTLVYVQEGSAYANTLWVVSATSPTIGADDPLLISPDYLPGKDLHQFDTVAGMVASTDLVAGNAAVTLGYLTAGDGGGNTYAIEADGYTASTTPFVVACSGATNAVGADDGGASEAFPRSDSVYAWLATTSGGAGSWVQDPDFEGTTYYLPLSTVAVGGGHNHPALAYAHRLAFELVTQPVYVIISASAAASIDAWVSSGTASTQYAALDTMLVNALAGISNTTVDHFMWVQGEADNADSAAVHEANLETLYTQLSGEPWWDGDTVFLACECVSYDNNFTEVSQNDDINTALSDFVDADTSHRKLVSADRLPSESADEFTGDALFTLGWWRAWDASGLPKYVTGRYDGGAYIELTGTPSLVARGLFPDGVVRAEQFGAVEDQEAAWAFNRANAFCCDQDKKLTLSSHIDIAYPVEIGRPGARFEVDLTKGRMEAVAGGAFSKTGPAILVQLRDTHLYHCQLLANKLCSGIEYYGNCLNLNAFRPDVWRFASADGSFGIKVSAASQAGLTVHDGAGAEWGQANAEYEFSANFKGRTLVIDGNDSIYFGGHYGHAKTVVLYTTAANTTLAIGIHPYCGLGLGYLAAEVDWTGFNAVEARGQGENYIQSSYIDGGYIADYGSALKIAGGFHLTPASDTQVMTAPFMRVQQRSFDSNFRNVTTGFHTCIGLFQNDDQEDLISDHWGYDTDDFQTTEGHRVNMSITDVELFASRNDDQPSKVYAKREGNSDTIKFRYLFPGDESVDIDYSAGMVRTSVATFRVDGAIDAYGSKVFTDRAAFIAADLSDCPDDTVAVWYNGNALISAIKSTGATAISDKSDWLPLGEAMPDHFGWVVGGSAALGASSVDDALTYIASIGGGTLLFGNYNLVTNGGHTYAGDNLHIRQVRGGEVRLGTNSTLFSFRSATETTGGELNYISVKDCKFRATHATATSSLAFDVGTVKYFEFTGNTIEDFYRHIDLNGTSNPCYINGNAFDSREAVATNTGAGGGSFIRCLPLEVDNGSVAASDEDIDDPGTYYRKCVGIFVNDNDFGNWLDSIDNGIVLQSVDGFTFSGNHILRCNGSQILMDPQTSADRLFNVKIDGDNHFDGSESYTDYCIRIAPRSYTTRIVGGVGFGSGHRIRIEDNQFDGAETRLLSCESDDVVSLVVRGNLFRNCPAATWVDIDEGAGVGDISSNTFTTKNGRQPTNVILAGSASSSNQFFDDLIIASNVINALDGYNATYNVHLVDFVNRVTLKDNIYTAGSGGSGDGFLYDQSSGGTVRGGSRKLGNVEIGGAAETGTFTPVVADAETGGNAATATTSSGRYRITEDMVTVWITLVDVDTTGLTGGNTLWIDGLPAAITAGGASTDRFTGYGLFGQVTYSGELTPTMRGTDTAIRFYSNSTGGSYTSLTVAALNSGSADISLSITYPIA